LTEQLYKNVQNSESNHWADGLAWLHTYRPSEPTFRQSLINFIRWRLESDVLDVFESVLECCVEASKKATDVKLRNTKAYDKTPVWLLPVIFEQLILAPNPFNHDEVKLNQLIHHRLRLFQSGQLQQLHAESRKVQSKTAKDFHDSPSKIQKSAQNSANNDNLGSANARLTKFTPVALINKNNFKFLRKLFPSSLKLGLFQDKVTTRGSKTNRKRIIFSPSEILDLLGRVQRGKAPGLQCDSLDIYVKIANRQTRYDRKHEGRDDKHLARTLAKFFTIVANGDVSDKFTSILRTTYTVALVKDPDDLTKLRPLGIPAAIRRITGALILYKFKGRFAEHLLPFNYAVGINGGIDLVTHTFRLGVEKYITGPENDGKLPSRALVSLDIKNMFNAISREQLIHIISHHFPELANFAELLYAEAGSTKVKMEDGTWSTIPVEEGFAQGCPLSPLFAGMVLNIILHKIHDTLSDRARTRLQLGNKGDDGKGGMPLIMAYVDDTNILVPLEDVNTVLSEFELIGEPLGAVMNTEKTRILTSTSHSSIYPRLESSREPANQLILADLKEAIDTYSTDKAGVGVEVTDGLRILGVPIGSKSFCQQFITNKLAGAQSDASKILNGLEDSQTMVQIYRQCTAHKLTHLFTSDVIANADLDALPRHWHLWDSQLATDFRTMTEAFLTNITRADDYSHFAHFMSAVPTRQGGLGIAHPKQTAIPTCILSIKRCLSFCLNGVWVGMNRERQALPHCITSLYKRWDSSPSRTFSIFRHYWRDLADICTSQRLGQDRYNFFLLNSSMNTCRERINLDLAGRLRSDLESLADTTTLSMLDDILDPKMSMALFEMSRIPLRNRIRSDIFTLLIKRKLRLNLWPTPPPGQDLICSLCKCIIDCKGDHCFACGSMNKIPMHDVWRDGIADIFKRLCVLVRLTSDKWSIDTETTGIISSLPRIRPFDLSISIDRFLDEGAWRSPLHKIGFDVTMVKPMPYSRTAGAAQQKHIIAQLQEEEIGKFERSRGGSQSDKGKQITLTGDQIIGEIIDNKMALIPIAISPYGRFGPIFNRFLYGSDIIPLPTLKKPNAERASKLSVSDKIPRGVLSRATQLWSEEHKDEFYGGSWRAQDPWTDVNQQLGLLACQANGKHIAKYINDVRKKDRRAKSKSKSTTSRTPVEAAWTPLRDAIDDASVTDTLRAVQFDCPHPIADLDGWENETMEDVDGYSRSSTRNTVASTLHA
jgi:hypothetical protein